MAFRVCAYGEWGFGPQAASAPGPTPREPNIGP